MRQITRGGAYPKTSTDVALLFLDEIEKSTNITSETVQALNAKIPEMFQSAIDKQTSELLAVRPVEQKPLDLKPISDGLASVQNQVLISANKGNTELVSKMNQLLDLQRDLITEVKEYNRPKKWRFDVQRNRNTGRIQSIEAEQI